MRQKHPAAVEHTLALSLGMWASTALEARATSWRAGRFTNTAPNATLPAPRVVSMT